MKTSKSFLLLAAFAIGVASSLTVAEQQPSHNSATIGFDGVGKAKVGMTIQQAERALGYRLVGDVEINDCAFFETKGGPDGLSFIAKDGRLRVVEVRDNRAITTQEGIRVGSTLAEVRRAFKNFRVHEFDHDGGQIISVKNPRSSEGTSMIVISIFNGKVAEIAAGDFSEMGSIERCT